MNRLRAQFAVALLSFVFLSRAEEPFSSRFGAFDPDWTVYTVRGSERLAESVSNAIPDVSMFVTESVTNGLASTNWVLGFEYVDKGVTNGLASTNWVLCLPFVTESVTNGLASTNWVLGLPFVTESVTNGLASTNWVLGLPFVTEAVTNGLASESYVDRHEWDWSAVTNHERFAVVEGEGSINDGYRVWDLGLFVTESVTNGLASEQFVLSGIDDATNGLASEDWVLQMGFVDESVTNGLASEQFVLDHLEVNLSGETLSLVAESPFVSMQATNNGEYVSVRTDTAMSTRFEDYNGDSVEVVWLGGDGGGQNSLVYPNETGTLASREWVRNNFTNQPPVIIITNGVSNIVIRADNGFVGVTFPSEGGRYAVSEGLGTYASGDYSHAEGTNTVASGLSAHSEGGASTAPGNYSHSEGYDTTAVGDYSHSEGYRTSSGAYSHSEGYRTSANVSYSHAEGYMSQALGSASHAEGSSTKAYAYGHSEGYYTVASNSYSHAEGNRSQALAVSSHAEGNQTTARGTASHAEGDQSYALGDASHAEGSGYATGTRAHAEGDGVATGVNSHAEGEGVAEGEGSHAEGMYDADFNWWQFPELEDYVKTTAEGDGSHAEGISTIALGLGSHSEGAGTVAIGNYSHAGGIRSWATNDFSFAIGTNCFAGERGSFVGGASSTNGAYCSFVYGDYNDTGTYSDCVTVFGSDNHIRPYRYKHKEHIWTPSGGYDKWVDRTGMDYTHFIAGMGNTGSGNLIVGLYNEVNCAGAVVGNNNVVGRGDYGTNSFASGSFVFGDCIQSTNSSAFVWNSYHQFDGMHLMPVYYDHGNSTFNINPLDGAAGVWIGESNLVQIIESVSGGSSHIDESMKWPWSSITNKPPLVNSVNGLTGAVSLDDYSIGIYGESGGIFKSMDDVTSWVKAFSGWSITNTAPQPTASDMRQHVMGSIRKADLLNAMTVAGVTTNMPSTLPETQALLHNLVTALYNLAEE